MRFLGLVVCAMAAGLFALMMYVAVRAGFDIGHQVSLELAISAAYAIAVVGAAQAFGVACLAFNISAVWQGFGAAIAALCASVLGAATWVYFVNVAAAVPHPFEDLFGLAPGEFTPYMLGLLCALMQLLPIVLTPMGWLIWREAPSGLDLASATPRT